MLRKLAISVVVLLLLLVGSAVALPLLFQDRIAAAAIDLLNERLDARVEVESVRVGLLRSFPNVRLQLEGLQVTGVGDFEGVVLVRVEELRAALHLLDFLRERQLRVQHFDLVRPEFQLRVLEDGRANWAVTQARSAEGSKGGGLELTLKRYGLREGQVQYQDAKREVEFALAGLEHRGRGKLSRERFTLQTSTAATSVDLSVGGVRSLRGAALDLDCDLDVDTGAGTITISDNLLRLDELQIGLAGGIQKTDEGSQVDLDFRVQSQDLKALLSMIPAFRERRFAELKAQGALQVGGSLRGLLAEGQLPTLRAQVSVADGAFSWPGLPESVQDIQVEGSLVHPDPEIQGTNLALSRFSFRVAGAPVEGRLQVLLPPDGLDVDGAVKGRMDLASLERAMPMKEGESYAGVVDVDLSFDGRPADVQAKRFDRIEAAGALIAQALRIERGDLPAPLTVSKARLELSPRHLRVSNFEAKLGDSDLAVEGFLDNLPQWLWGDDPLVGRLDLRSEVLDLDALRGASGGEEEGAREALRVPPDLDLALDARVGRLMAGGLELREVDGRAAIRERALILEGLDLETLGGSVRLEGRYDSAPLEPRVDMDLDVRRLDLGRAAATFDSLRKVAPIVSASRGTVSTRMTLAGRFDEAMSVVLDSLGGDGLLSTTTLIVEGAPSMGLVADALQNDRFRRLDLSGIRLPFRFEEGKVTVRPFGFDLGPVHARASGSHHFDQDLDYRIRLDLPVAEFAGRADSVLQDLVQKSPLPGLELKAAERVQVDVLIGGSVKEPKVRLALAEVARQTVEDLVEQVTEEVVEEVEEQVDRVLEQADERARAEAEKMLEAARAEADRVRKAAKKAARIAKDQAHAAADRLVEEARGPLAKAAAQTAAQVAKKEADAAHKKAVARADAEYEKAMSAARKRAERMIEEARSKTTGARTR
jgi:uncharacterized protein involved in outer membrane biogenesis